MQFRISTLGKVLLLAVMSTAAGNVSAQEQGQLSGDLMMNVNFYDRDSTINAANNPLYDNYLSGGEAWLSFRYSWKGFTAFLRADAYHNSNLYNPTEALTGFGIGAWSLSKDLGSLNVTGGYIYDQIGSGILFRAYEDRGLLIDNALVGVRVKYQLNDHISLKAYTGQQKNVATITGRYAPIIKAFNAEGDYSLSDKVHIAPGIGILNRTLDAGSMGAIVSGINAQDLDTRFVPRYNTYAFTAYNNLVAGDVSWYIEGAYKTHEAIIKDDMLQDLSGNVVYSTLAYARKGFAINLSGKRTENFVLRTSPNEILLRGVLNWQPVIARLRPQRLIARYTPPSQDISEQAIGADILLAPNDDVTVTLNATHINTLEGTKLYRELYGDVEYRTDKNWILDLGVQYLEYNQQLYQQKPNVPMFKAITGFAEATYRVTDRKSLRAEAQYMHTEQDYGSWVFGLLEYNIAPKWSFAISDMYNVSPNKEVVDEGRHYYNIFAAYTHGPTRFTAQYVKQVEGVNCTGGVCRYEPAFSGVKLGLTTTF